MTIGLDRLCNFVWWYYTHDRATPDIERLRARIWQPPIGTVEIDARSPWSAENEQSAFGALKASLGTKTRGE